MSRARLISSLTVIACTLALAAGFAVWTFPLKAAPHTRRVRRELKSLRQYPASAVAQEQPTVASKPVVEANSIWTDKVKRGDMVLQVRGLGTLALLNGKPMAPVELPEQQATDVRVGQSAQVDTHKGIVSGHVMRVSLQVVSGMRNVYIVLDSALPAGLDAHAQVEGIITTAKLENVLYVGRPVQDKAGSIFKVVDDGKEAERVEVHFGRVSASTIQVLSGLNVGDTVILSDMAPYANFDRIQIK